MKKNVLFLFLSLVIIISTVLVGCSPSPSSTPSVSPAKTTPPATSAVAPPATSSVAPPAKTTPPATSSVAPPATTAAATIKLKFASQNPDNGREKIDAGMPWLNAMTAATNGRVQFEPYYSQTLVKGVDAWTGTKNGIADVAWMFHGYWANMTPLADVLTLPLMPFKNAKQASGIFWQLYQKYPTLAAEFKDNHVLLTFASSPYFLITSKKQVKVMDDWKNLKIRVTAGPPVDMMKALGAVPVAVPMPDTYLSLQKGVIDGMLVSWDAMMSFKQYEVVKYYTYVPLVTVYFTIAMNNDKWNSLPADVQTQINSVCGLKGSIFWGDKQFDILTVDGRTEAQKSGVEMVEYTVPADELAKWSAIARPIWDAWVKSMTDQGHPEAKDILNDALNLAMTYNP
jgi:TRAP-type C4-dicarboxylate transport system substrate-binding protein